MNRLGFSSKVTTMNERPNCVCENMRIEFGTPASAISSGMVTCFSTSSGARPGKRLMTVTWVSVTSGKASIGSERKAETPTPMNSTSPRMMNSGSLSAKWTMRFIIGRLASADREGS